MSDEKPRATLSDKQARGGVIGGKGYGFQAAYLASRIPLWLDDPDFAQFLQEGAGDVDVRFNRADGEERWYVQVKNYEVKLDTAREVLAQFLDTDIGSPGTYTRFTLACPGLHDKLRRLRAVVEEYRGLKDFYRLGQDEILDNTWADLESLVGKLDLPVDAAFLVDKVYFDTDLAGLTDDASLCDLFVGRLLKLETWARATRKGAAHAYEKLALLSHRAIRQTCSREQVEILIQEAVGELPVDAAYFTVPFMRNPAAIRDLLTAAFDDEELPLDAPLHERLGNVGVYILGQISMDSIATGLQLLALLSLGGLWAWIIAGGEGLDLQSWELIGIIWLGLTVLPLIAGNFPQRREEEIRAKFKLKKLQGLSLWLGKAFGIYISAFLGETAAVLIWLLLIYAGLWANLSLIVKAVFWFVMALVTFLLSLVGSIIAVRYSWNLSKSGQAPRLRGEDALLGLGFPLIVYPGLMLFGWITAPIWSHWQTGCPTIVLAFLGLVLMLRREAKRQPVGVDQKTMTRAESGNRIDNYGRSEESGY